MSLPVLDFEDNRRKLIEDLTRLIVIQADFKKLSLEFVVNRILNDVIGHAFVDKALEEVLFKEIATSFGGSVRNETEVCD